MGMIGNKAYRMNRGGETAVFLPFFVNTLGRLQPSARVSQ